MNDFIYEWDKEKYRANIAKHGIPFDEAMTVFDDDNALYKPDPDHSYNEERFIILGMSAQTNLLVVCHCYRESDTIVRIFSARPANRMEESEYGERL